MNRSRVSESWIDRLVLFMPLDEQGGPGRCCTGGYAVCKTMVFCSPRASTPIPTKDSCQKMPSSTLGLGSDCWSPTSTVTKRGRRTLPTSIIASLICEHTVHTQRNNRSDGRQPEQKRRPRESIRGPTRVEATITSRSISFQVG